MLKSDYDEIIIYSLTFQVCEILTQSCSNYMLCKCLVSFLLNLSN